MRPRIPRLPQFTLGGKTVHIWRMDLEANPEEETTLAGVLSNEERDRAAKLSFERDRRRYIVAHARLRQILGGYLDCAAEEVGFQVAERGKPRLAGASNLRFNLAHSHERAAVAVTRAGEVGVDVEYRRPLDDMHRLAKSCFSPLELQAFERLPAAERQRGFFDAWTRKEAYIKALGLGLACPLDSFSVSLSSDPAALLEVAHQENEAARWTLESFDAGPDYSAAYALRCTQVDCILMDIRPILEVANG